MNIGYSEDKNDATHTVCVNNEEIKAVGKLELLGVILISLIIYISSICKRASQRKECL